MSFLSKKEMPHPIRYTLKVYGLGMGMFFLFRTMLLFSNWDKVMSLPQDRIDLILHAFWMGIRFDTVISNYILLLPFVLLSFSYFIRRGQKTMLRIISIYLTIFYSIAFMLCSADIPYFSYFSSRLTTAALAWTDNISFMFGMVFQEFKYWGMLIPLLLLLGFFSWRLKRIRKEQQLKVSREAWSITSFSINIFASLVFAGIMFIGIRGRVEKKSPIQVGTAFFCSHAFPNQLGLNPVFTFMHSYIEDNKSENKEKHIMDVDQAFNFASRKLGATDTADYSVGRKTNYDQIPGRKRNVVLVIMESMSAGKMGRYGNENNLTPFLDSLAQHSLSFDNMYTAGIHTFNGIFSTLYSIPAVYKKHPMKGFPIKNYTGLAPVLKDAGYTTTYFTTHDDQFDNIGGFLHANGFDQIVSQKDYPSNEVLSTLGVPDHFMFNYAFPILNEKAKENRPFLGCFMTTSDHGPYIIPKGITFKPNAKDIRQQIIEYADWSIAQFMHKASKQDWYDNTIFVFVADHGYNGRSTYDMPLNYHHSPMIIYSPAWKNQAEAYQQMATQLDVSPTIIGLLGINWENKTLGIDLLNEERPFAYFCADNKLGCINEDYFLVMRENGPETLYRYKTKDTKDYSDSQESLLEQMRLYAKAMTTVAQKLMQ